MARLLSGCFGSPDAKYRFEKERTASFRTWPGKPKCLPLASAGFSYTASADEVICFSCRGRISNWKESDRPFQTHRYYFPHCKHVTGHDSGDVPLYDRLPQNEGNDPFPNLASGRTQTESNETDIRDPGQSSDSLTNDRCSPTPLLEQVYGHRSPCSDGMNAEGTPTTSTSFVLAEQQKELEPSSERQLQLETPSDAREVINGQISGNQGLSKTHYQGGMPQPGLDNMVLNQHATNSNEDVQFSSCHMEPWQAVHTPTPSRPNMVCGTATSVYVQETHHAQETSISAASHGDGMDEDVRLAAEIKLPTNSGAPTTSPHRIRADAYIQTDYDYVKDENESLKKEKRCKICFDADCEGVFIPCFHMVACESCGLKLKKCPLCRIGVKWKKVHL